MSYILDALKRSEQERLQGDTPDLLAGPQSERTGHGIHPIWLAAVLGVNALLLAGWWLWPEPAPAEPPPTPPIADASSTSGPSVRSARVPAPTAAARELPVAATTQPTARPASQPPALVIAPGSRIHRRADRQEPTRAADTAGFPPLVVSTHIYSSDETIRSITVNGTRLREGEAMANGVVIQSINEDGAIVSYRGQERSIKVMQDWGL